MERTKFYSKDELAHELGISSKTLLNRIQKNDNEVLKALYKENRLFSIAEREYILDKVNYQFANTTFRGDGNSTK